MRWHIKSFPVLLTVFAITLNACGTMLGTVSASEKKTAVKITSDPAGATVFLAGEKHGVTPVSLPYDAFPEKRVGLIARKTGVMSLRKEGCQPWKIHLNEKVLGKNIHAKLVCGKPQKHMPVAEEKTPAVSRPMVEHKPVPTAVLQPGTAEFRLKRLNDLHGKGLITDEEYRRKRKEIIDSL